MLSLINEFALLFSVGITMATEITAGRAAASLALRVLRGVLVGLSKNGKVSLADIDRTIALIERGTVELDRAYARTHHGSVSDAEKSLLAIAEAEIEEEKDESGPQQNRIGMRSDPIHRLLALPLEPMFFATPPTFERKFLSAYFTAARQLIGPQFISFDAECKAIIQSMLPMHGKQLTWEIIYAEPRTIMLMRRTFGVLAGKLGDAKGEAVWAALMAQPAADGVVPSQDQIDMVREAILAAHRRYADPQGG
jgi:hypothetical protein